MKKLSLAFAVLGGAVSVSTIAISPSPQRAAVTERERSMKNLILAVLLAFAVIGGGVAVFAVTGPVAVAEPTCSVC